MKVSNKMFKEFLEIIDDYGEIVFGDEKYLKKQLENVLNTQGCWAGIAIRIYYENGNFRVENRF